MPKTLFTKRKYWYLSPTAPFQVAKSSVLLNADESAGISPDNPPVRYAGKGMKWCADKAAFCVGLQQISPALV